jgi:hypothetical protein
MARVTPIGEQLQQVLQEMKESFWGEGRAEAGRRSRERGGCGDGHGRGMPCARPAIPPLD